MPEPSVSALSLDARQLLLFDFDNGDSWNVPATSRHVHEDSRSRSVLLEVQQWLQTSDTFERQLFDDVQRLLKQQSYNDEGRDDNMILASMLAGIGYRVRTRKALGGGMCLRHTYLCVAPTADPESSSLMVVELHLKDHFEISSPSPEYKALLDSLPEVFVGSMDRLAAIVSLLCREMAQVFSTNGRVLPPWRKLGSMLSKWFSCSDEDTDVTADYCLPKSVYSPELPPIKASAGAQFGTTRGWPW